MTDAATVPERRIVLTGASNFRDIGGYPTADGRTTRWRRVFRADALQDLTPDDVRLLAAFNLGDVFDLRTLRELEVFGTNPLVAHGVRHHHLPFVTDIGIPAAGGAAGEAAPTAPPAPAPDDHAAHAQHYLDMLERSKPALRRILGHLAAAPEQSVVFHCTGGRDRTGLTAALLLEVLGVPREVIVTDYALTTRYLEHPPSRIEQMRALFGDRIAPSGGPVATRAEVMALTLAGLDARYGSPRTYLETAGVGVDQQEALRRALLEPEH